MHAGDFRGPLQAAAQLAIDFLDGLPERPVAPRQSAAEVLAGLDGPVPAESTPPAQVIAELARAVEPGLTAMPSGRFFGWVIGGGLPAAVGADWLTSAWDQNAGSAEGTPGVAAVEQVAIRWVLELLGLPANASAALVTGAQTANTVGLAAARHRVLAAAGWDVERDGLGGAPAIDVLVGAERHDTVMRSLRLLGLGAGRARVIDADGQGRMRPAALAAALAAVRGPVIVVAQAGNVNTGAVDPMGAVADAVDGVRARVPAWLHVDGAFGLWARVSPAHAALVAGVERADSWATDAHKWLNTPYDCGIAIVRDRAAHRGAMAIEAAYLPDSGDSAVRSPFDWTPELSRRARGVALWAALRQLGRAGVVGMVERCCAHARRFAERLSASGAGIEIMNEVVLNQVLVRFQDPAGHDHDAHTHAVVRRVQQDGVCYPTGTTWHGRAAMRISVSNWSTDEADVDRSVEAIVRQARSSTTSGSPRAT